MAKKHHGKKTEKKPTDERGENGRFLPGNPGGPGRPKGSRNETAELVEQLLAADAIGLTRALIRSAKRGQSAALKIAFDRLCPARTDRPVEFDMPAQSGLIGLVDAHDRLLEAVSAGQLAPSEAEPIARLLEARRRATELVDVEVRLAKLEERLPAETPLKH